MRRLNLTAMLRTAATNLENSLHHYEDPVEGPAREFVELKLQASIFHYDVCAEMVSFIRNKPSGFPASVALKGLVLRLYEYDNLINSTFIPRLLALAKSKGVDFTAGTVKRIKAPWKAELSRIKRWSDVRNYAAGHYGKDFRIQVALLKKLVPEDVMNATTAFLSFNMALLVGLRDVGLGKALDA